MVKIYVEGGGDAASLKTECRQGFSKFFESAGFKGKMPRVVPCGGRNDAYDSFCTAIGQGEGVCAFLLVDSEDVVDATHQQGKPDQWKPWEHLKQRDNWDKPSGTADSDCHLMVQCMEAWFIADRQALAAFFGQDFKQNKLPNAANPIESVSKQQLYTSLADATKLCPKGQYGKGSHSFKLLALINPTNVTTASPWAKRLIDTLKERMK